MKRAIVIVLSCIVVIAAFFYIRSVIHETIEMPQAGQHYLVSLGDSVASGAGLNDGGKGSDGCDLSTDAFPYLAAAQLKLKPIQFACSGATVAPEPGSSNNLLDNQYTHAKPYIHGGDVVVQAGANDVDWLQTLVACAQAQCTATAADAKLNTMQQNLTMLLKRIQSDKPRKLIVNTYYRLLNPGDTCFAKLGLTGDKVTTIVQLQGKLNTAITAAAQDSKARAVSIDFSGHMLCDGQPYIQGLADRAPLHPTAAGQRQIATQDVAAFTAVGD